MTRGASPRIPAYLPSTCLLRVGRRRMHHSPYSRSKYNFILQQGLQCPTKETCGTQYNALVFQPRVIGLLVLAGAIFQWGFLFLALAVTLSWSALFPQWNPFDAIYNHTRISARGKEPVLSPAPPPRRFAQGMAATFSLIIALSLFGGWHAVAIVFELLFLAAVSALALGRFCLGSFVFHAVRGRLDFALRTLPWRRGPD